MPTEVRLFSESPGGLACGGGVLQQEPGLSAQHRPITEVSTACSPKGWNQLADPTVALASEVALLEMSVLGRWLSLSSSLL